MLHRGRVAYFGPNGDAAWAYLAGAVPGLRLSRPCEGLSDFIISVITEADKQGGDGAHARFADAYRASQLRQDNEARLAALLADAEVAHQASERGLGASQGRCCGLAGRLGGGGGGSGTVVPWWWAVWTLWQFRGAASLKRGQHLGPRIADKLLTVFLICTLFWGLGNDSDALSVTPVAAVLFMWVITAAYGSMAALPSLVLERPVYIREVSDGLFSPLTFLLYKASEEELVALLASIPYSLLVYYLVRLQGSFALFWLVWFATISCATVLALLCGAISPNLEVASATLPSYTGALLYFAGFLIPWADTPAYWKWFGIIDYLRYCWGALMVNQFAGERNVVAYGDQHVLEYYSLAHVSAWAWLGWAWLFWAVFLGATWAALALVKHQRR